MTDEELQKSMEGGLSGDGADERAYRAVFNALKKEPSFRLSSDFTSKVMSRVRPETSTSRDFFWLCAGLVSVVIAMIVAIVMTDFKFALPGFSVNWGVLKFISGYPGLIAFGVSFILFLQWLDKKVLRKTSA